MIKCNYMPATVQLSDILDDNKFIIPNFQRSVVWKPKRRKEFIANLRNGEPFGVILIRMNNNKYELIDGLQRITTIRDYVAHPFNYLTEDDLNEELIEEILKIHLEDIGVSVDPKYISDRLPELKSYIFECIKGDLRLWDLIENVKEKFDFKSRKISELLDKIYSEFESEKDISNLTVMAIDYRGPSENIPNVFYNLNTGGVQLTKYETYAALWSTPLFKVADKELLHNVKNKYLQLQEDSDLDVDFDEDDLSDKGITLFEYCYALGGVIRNKDKKYDLLFGENIKSTDPLGFEVLALLLELNVNKAERIHNILKSAPASFLVDIKNMLDDALGEIKKSLKDVLIGLTKSALTSDSNYLMYHMLISYIRQYYSIDVKAWKIVKKSETLALKDFRKFAQLHYVYDCITDYWRINRQVSDLQRDLNDAVKRNKYWSAITMAQWEKGIDDLISAQSSVSKTIPQKNKLFIDFLMKMKLKEKPQYFVHFMNTDEEDSGFLDFEHIIPKKIIQMHIKDLSVSQQNLFSVSSIGNLCYLTVTDNRAKREKTIYEFKENRPSYSFDMDYLSFIEYPAEDDIVFMKYPNIEFRQGYERFINNRMEKLRVEFLRLIRKTYFEHQ